VINNILFLGYEICFFLLLITSIKILLLYISGVFSYTTKSIKICGGPRDSVKIRSRSLSASLPRPAVNCSALDYKTHGPQFIEHASVCRK
jgi:hypothetical protein